MLSCLAESAVILAQQTPNDPLSDHILGLLVPGPAALVPIGAVTPELLAGTALTISGAGLRLWCYRTLGRHFTFKLYLQEGHELVTDGPYRIVRHPSYTGLLLTEIGAFLLQFAAGTLFREAGWARTRFGQGYMCFWLLLRSFETVGFLVRTVYEDRFLRARFGEQWKSWARRTPHRLIPFVY